MIMYLVHPVITRDTPPGIILTTPITNSLLLSPNRTVHHYRNCRYCCYSPRSTRTKAFSRASTNFASTGSPPRAVVALVVAPGFENEKDRSSEVEPSVGG